MKIEKNVEIPERPKYSDTFKLMEVGDSFTVCPTKRHSVTSALSLFNRTRTDKYKFISKLEENKKFLRFWRVK